MGEWFVVLDDLGEVLGEGDCEEDAWAMASHEVRWRKADGEPVHLPLHADSFDLATHMIDWEATDGPRVIEVPNCIRRKRRNQRRAA